MIFFTFQLLFLFIFHLSTPSTIEINECQPPDYPQWGGYGPRQEVYFVGDIIHYYCDTDTYIGGNYYRICGDHGDWIGDTPICDIPAEFSSVSQSSTAQPEDENIAELAVDGLRSTCSSTRASNGTFWRGVLAETGEMLRVMLFMPKGRVAYDVILVKRDGSELSCGTRFATIDHMDWAFHNCPGPNNRDAVELRIQSLSSEPLQICDMMVHVLVAPTCVDPHLQIENGRLQLSRKSAILVCEPSFTRGPNHRIECVRDGVWNRRNLYCLDYAICDRAEWRKTTGQCT